MTGSQALGQELPFVHYTVDSDLNPLPSAAVNEIVLDSQGFLWFVIHSSGLFRYDGHTSEVFTSSDGLPANSTVGMIEDQKGRLWVLTRHGVAVLKKPLQEYLPGERLAFTVDFQGIKLSTSPGNKESGLTLAPDGAVWLATESGVLRYSYDSNGNLQSQNLLLGDGTLGKSEVILARRDGQIWVVTEKNKLAQFSLGGDDANYSEIVFSSACAGIMDIEELASGETIIACRSGRLFELERKLENGSFQAREVLELKSPLTTINEGPDGSLWLGTEGSGVYYAPEGLGGKGQTMISRKNGLIGDSTRRVLQDPEGNIWIAQSGGVSKLQQNYKAFQTYTANSQAGERPVLPSPGVQTVRVADKPVKNSMWLGTNQGLVVRTPDGVVDLLGSEDGLKDPNVWIQCHDADGRVWFNASSTLGVITFEGTPSPKGFSQNRAIEFAGQRATLSMRDWAGPRGYSCTAAPLIDQRDSRGYRNSVCFSGARHVECWVDDGSWTILGRQDGLVVDSNVQSILIEANGHLLVGTEAQGIFQSTRPLSELLNRSGYNRSTDTVPSFKAVWGPSSGAPTGDVEYMLIRKGFLWVGTDQGLLKIDPKTMNLLGSVTVAQGLPDDFAVSLYESPTTGYIWVGTNAGIAEVDPDKLKVVRTVTRTDGLVDNEVWWLQSVYVGGSGAVYYGTPKGLSIYKPSEHSRNMKLPKPVFRQKDLNVLQNGTNEIKVGYSALSYSEEKGVRYKYRILGYDDNWSDVTADASQKFMNLPAVFVAQDYRFELLASNNDGIWAAEPITWDFSIAPPWWLRWWFWFGVICVLSLSVVAVYRQRTRRLGERARELKEFAEALQRAVDNLDEELEERRRVEGKLNEVRMKMFSAEKAAQHAHERRNVALMELKSAKETLIQAEKLSSLGQMVASISHEIANPVWLVGATAQDLSSQIGDLEEFLKSLFDESAQAQRVVENIHHRLENMRSALENSFTASGRLTDITQALRTQSRFDRSPTSGVALNEVIKESLIITGGKTKRHTVIKEIGDLPLVTCFRSHIGQVITNLLANAADALDECVTTERAKGKIFKGKIRVCSYPEVRDEIEGVCVAVGDNGAGVDENLREQVFEAFFTTKPSGMGTGLGLSVCATIVQDHAGDISVETDEQLAGARFVIWLPVQMKQSDEFVLVDQEVRESIGHRVNTEAPQEDMNESPKEPQ